MTSPSKTAGDGVDQAGGKAAVQPALHLGVRVAAAVRAEVVRGEDLSVVGRTSRRPRPRRRASAAAAFASSGRTRRRRDRGRCPSAGGRAGRRRLDPGPARSSVQPWNVVPITGNGCTGSSPCRQSASRRRRGASRPSSAASARSECTRPIAAGTKTSSVRSMCGPVGGRKLRSSAADAARAAITAATTTTPSAKRIRRH